ncbi:preprotein translocase subunit YajC [Spelaeicoccus albus]|uniref:Preprotein translocase subunit YajC n=1 Tax=Spelaeicoccus albus TaxID=1280376 RepID=A0A7Z0D4D1_9MICO|nr:preprotein translocase subunit YajC [Spelaeicoccus albus]NYI68653.1 preprotein translocase subunit YajC [Spelaeicoccus albus]
MSIILVVVLGGLLIFMMFNSSRKRKAQQQEMATKLGPGAEIMTTFGVFGTVVSMDDTDNRVVLETTPGTQLTVHKQAVGKILEAAPSSEFGDEDIDVPDDASSLTDDGHVAEYGTYGEAVDAQARRDDDETYDDEYDRNAEYEEEAVDAQPIDENEESYEDVDESTDDDSAEGYSESSSDEPVDAEVRDRGNESQ